MPDLKQIAPVNQEKIPRIEVYWTAVTYRTVAIYLALIVSVLLAAVYMLHPEVFTNIISRLAGHHTQAGNAALLQNQARFVNLDGKVEVKKANSVMWGTADYRTTLDKGDLIRTSSDGAARITFVDGTTYTVKNDSFVTVEENSIDRDRSTKVGVHITSGAVDLATGTWESPNSKAEVSFANARASLQENTRAAVQSNASGTDNQITISAGTANLQVGDEHVDIGKWERVSFSTGGTPIKSSVLAPPDLTEPVNLQPLIAVDPRHAPVHFAWSTVTGAASYQFRVSTNSMFTRVVAEKIVTTPSVEITGLNPGDYFWAVTAIDKEKHESAPSESFKLTLVAQAKAQEMLLELDGTALHGSVVEVIGRTEPNAALIINGETVAGIQLDGRFRYFTQALSRGSHEIVIIGQNRRGGTAIKRVPIVIP